MAKSPKFKVEPKAEKNARASFDPESSNRQTPCWQLSQIDFEGPWGWGDMGRDVLLDEIHRKLSNFESMTWGEILAATGGRRSGNNSHFVSIEDLCREARQRLEELRRNDLDELFSLRLTGRGRVWGVRIGRVLQVLWYDRDHQVCPSSV